MVKTRVNLLLVAWLSSHAALGEGAASGAPEVIAGSVSDAGGYTIAGAKGATYRLRTGYRLELAPSTALRFERSTKLQLSTNASTPTQVLELRSGRIEIQCPKETSVAQALMVTTPNKVMGVFTKGEGAVLVANQEVTVASRQGGTLVGVGNDWRPLLEGHARTISPEDRVGKPRPLVSAPEVRLSSTLMLSVEGGESSLRLHWKSTPDAARYEVRLASPGAEARELATDQTAAELSGMKPGRYSVTVRAFDRNGLPGTPSTAQSIRIVGVALPAGAYFGRDGAIRLGPEQRVRLSGAGDLRMSYGQVDRFGHAPESLGLHRGRAVDVRLRDPESSGELRVRLVPVLDHASVSFQPQQPRWPGKPVTVEVRLYDGNHEPAPAGVEVVPDLRINSRKLTPRWVRQGNRLVARVSPPTPIGPWAMRVQIARPGGDVIARTWLRIAER
jgi:hypothetical protein